MKIKKLGFIINPIAGIGGKVGLKGSDGLEIQKQAIALGAMPEASKRASQALQQIESLKPDLEILCFSGEMGEDIASDLGFRVKVMDYIRPGKTTSKDTRMAAQIMAENQVHLLVFVGGDGTARDIYDAVGEEQVVLGIPAGVKIHSAVFANNPLSAGELVLRYLQGGVPIRENEVMDIDEEAFQEGKIISKLYGYLRVPYHRNLIQCMKSASSVSEKANLEGIAVEVIHHMKADCLYILGPGTTTRAITNWLKLPKTLLGVDLILNKVIIGMDVGEQDILRQIDYYCSQGKQASIVVTPIGGQGFVFGRGNQQISSQVIKKVGKKRTIIISTAEKIQSLEGKPLLVDTGDKELDKELSGYVRVLTGYREELVYPLSSNSNVLIS